VTGTGAPAVTGPVPEAGGEGVDPVWAAGGAAAAAPGVGAVRPAGVAVRPSARGGEAPEPLLDGEPAFAETGACGTEGERAAGALTGNELLAGAVLLPVTG
jgi:hypothetical protein